jgi:hypothetical protein
MKKILLEEISRMKVMMGLNDDLLTEGSKLKILTDKLGLSQEAAEYLDETCGSSAVWMYHKLFENYIVKFNDFSDDEEMVQMILDSAGLKTWNEWINKLTSDMILGDSETRSGISNIMNWIKVKLKGNWKPFENATYDELVLKSKELTNYSEKNPVILDFRDKEGNGFYWAYLDSGTSKEECDRMGHCGRSDKGRLYSLRSSKHYHGVLENSSHLTAAIGYDGVMYQLKGPSNSKPKVEYHKYILPLFYNKKNGKYLITSIGEEYESGKDFKIDDLSDDMKTELKNKRPDLFGGDVNNEMK